MRKRMLTQKMLVKKVLYFAYGSNMHQPRLEERVGQVKYLGRYELRDFKLTFDTGNRYCTFANIDFIKGEFCEGIIYEMTYGQLRILDEHEGLYIREFVMRGRRKLHFYISDIFRRRNMTPNLTREYYALLMLGCTEHKLKKSLSIIAQHKPPARTIIWERLMFYAED